jgi:hypothetical protein
MAVGILRAWMPRNREREATEELVGEIEALEWDKAVEAVKTLQNKRRFIRGTKGQDLRLKATLENIKSG